MKLELILEIIPKDLKNDIEKTISSLLSEKGIVLSEERLKELVVMAGAMVDTDSSIKVFSDGSKVSAGISFEPKVFACSGTFTFIF